MPPKGIQPGYLIARIPLINRIRQSGVSLLLLLSLIVLLGTSCTKDEDVPVVISATVNGQEASNLTTTKNSTVTINFNVVAPAAIDKIEISSRSLRGTPIIIESFQKYLNQIEGNTFTKSYEITAINDFSYSIYVIDVNGNYSGAQVDVLLDISEFDNVTLGDAKLDGASKTFFDTRFGLPLSVSYSVAEPAAIDFGFIYMENNASVKASFVSFSDFAKTATYPVIGDQNNITQFKKAAAMVYTDAASLKQAFDSGSAYPSILGIEAGRAVPNIAVNDVIAFKTQRGKYGLIQIKAIDRKGEANKNEQTIGFKLAVQK